ncbi:MAG: hypothetical protein H0V04_02110 [Chloroflexi bacterium]|nr:hypothetical protein [Chloroflexota bacterium]
MASDLTVSLEDRPGTLAQLGEVLGNAGIECGEDREVEMVSIVDQPGEMGRHLRRVADAGVNVDLAYLATNTRLVLGADDPDGLRRALHG